MKWGVPETSIVLDVIVCIELCKIEGVGTRSRNGKSRCAYGDSNVTSHVSKLLEGILHHRDRDVATVCLLSACALPRG